MSIQGSSHRTLARLAGIIASALTASVGAAAPEAGAATNFAASYTYTTLDYPGATGTIFWGLNDFGELAGQYNMSGVPGHAMAYRHGHFESLDPSGLFDDGFSAAGGPDDFGTIFGGYTDAAKLQHGFVLQWGFVQTVDFAGHLNSNVDSLNLSGSIAGVYWDADGVYHGVLREHGVDTSIDVPGANDTYPLGIDGDGDVVGYWWGANPAETHGFLRSADGQFTTIDVPGAGAGGTAVFAINDVGQMAGYYADPSGLLHGFIERNGKYQTLDVPGASLTIVTALNNFGMVAGEYFDAAGKRHGFVGTPW